MSKILNSEFLSCSCDSLPHVLSLPVLREQHWADSRTKVDRKLRGTNPPVLSTGDQHFNQQNQQESSQGVRAVTSRVLGDNPPSPSMVAADQEKGLLSQHPLHPSTQTCLTKNSTGVSREETPMVSSILKGQAQEGSHLPTLLPPGVGQQPETDPFHPQHTGGMANASAAAQGLFWSGNKSAAPLPLVGAETDG